MSKPTTRLMEDLLKIVDEHAAQRHPQELAGSVRANRAKTLPLQNRVTAPIVRSPITIEMTAPDAQTRKMNDSSGNQS